MSNASKSLINSLCMRFFCSPSVYWSVRYKIVKIPAAALHDIKMSTEGLDPEEKEAHTEYFQAEFLKVFFKVDQFIHEKKVDKLLEYVNNKSNPVVNLSGDLVLHVVIAYGKSDLACDLIDEVHDPSKRLAAMRNKITGDTALHVAASVGDEMVAKKLLETDYHLLQKLNKRKETPLHKAAFYGQRRMFHMLADAGADVTTRTGVNGNNVLHCAILSNTPDN